MVNKVPVVQGIAVASPYEHNHATSNTTQTDRRFEKGEKQPTRCRDPFFALLFYAQLAAMIACAFIYGPAAREQYAFQGLNISGDATGYLKLAAVLGVISLVLSGLMLSILMCIPQFIIKVALFFNLGIWIAYAVLGFMTGNFVLGVIGALFALLSMCYIWAVWSRIPFATANLVTGITAVRSNCCITGVAYFFSFLGIGWYYVWSLVFVGVFATLYCSNGVCDTNAPINWGYFFLLMLSFYFTTQVIQNSVHVTVAGTVGTWWYSPEDANSCCSSAIVGSTVRTLTTSFGSVCFGSLIVAIIQATRALVNAMRSEDNSILLCIADCILGCLEGLVEYFNMWAYVYVGLYGYPYLKAGKSVMELFHNRGWDAVIADNLVSGALFMISLVVGLVAGGIGFGFTKNPPAGWFPGLTSSDVWVGFVFGFIIGLVLCSILMSVIGSAVNTVIVCFAEGPAEFQRNHPRLSEKMRAAWLQAYPGCI